MLGAVPALLRHDNLSDRRGKRQENTGEEPEPVSAGPLSQLIGRARAALRQKEPLGGIAATRTATRAGEIHWHVFVLRKCDRSASRTYTSNTDGVPLALCRYDDLKLNSPSDGLTSMSI